MNNFNDFGIKPAPKGLVGEKIKIEKILNKEIVVEDFKIKDSKYEGKGKCLHMQLINDNVSRVLFSGSQSLIEMIEKVDRSKLPFKTTIVKDNDRLEFT